MLTEFGAPGQLGWLVLILEAKREEYAQLDPAKRTPGTVKLAWSTFAQMSGCDHANVDAKALLDRLAALGELTYIDHGHAFTATLTDWSRWEAEPKDPKAAERKRIARKGRQPAADVRPPAATGTWTATNV
jgi:hypothetical protein